MSEHDHVLTSFERSFIAKYFLLKDHDLKMTQKRNI